MRLYFLFISLLVSPLAADFQKDVLPILKKSCLECHQPHEKRGRMRDAKGGLRLDSAFGIAQGGDGGAAVVPGKPEESLLFTLAALDPDDDDVMPTNGETLSKKELSIIKTWIEKGADFGKWRGVNKADPVWPLDALPEKERKELPKLPQKAIFDFKKLPFIVRPVAAKSPYLEVEWMGNGEEVKSSDLRVLSLYKERILRVHFKKLKLGTEAMKQLSKLESLEVLNLIYCELPSLSGINKLSKLERLNLYASKAKSPVRKEGLSQLKHYTPLGS